MRELARLGLAIGDSGAAPLAALHALRTDPRAPRCARGLARPRPADRHRRADRPVGYAAGDRVTRDDLPVRRNTLLLAAAMAVVLGGAPARRPRSSSLTFVLVTGVKGLLGLGPAIFLIASGRWRRCPPGG